MTEYALRLYVAGRTPRSTRAIANLRRLCDERVPGRVEVEIVDVSEQPQRAEADRIIATPTLVREQPPPQRRVIGDLSDPERVLAGLGLLADVEVDGPVAGAGAAG